ncbi:MAG: hypothetical protein AVDCRST_MAG61-223 [uncultured Friedmanniella sp.]|uniref:Histidine kinase domain-containing protein n=1 Tax=uncultured Friedmanniella sp. TaxID=335381 RepID=A0A6J4K0M0_9ACTN|nr:ATP-binding protein [uncultured Friedmanniella sp.]CAA9291999.1 MAG: hypothetical protein AVDCRST_MAG61-223 [uncultured Friedmanniella sp.]
MLTGVRSGDARAVVLRRTAAVVITGLIVTAVVLTSPYVVFGLYSPSGHLILNSLDACIALLVAFLLHGRFMRRHRLQDLMLSQGLVFLAVAGLGLTYLSRLLPDVQPGTVDVWLPLGVRLAGVLLLAASALVGDRSYTPARRHRWPLVPVVSTVLVLSTALWLSRDGLPVALDVDDISVDAAHPLLTGHPVLLLAQVLAALGYGLAAVLYTVRAGRDQDELLGWIGPAFVLGAFARVHYLLFPSLYTDWLYTGDLLRTGCHVLLLVGATREIQQFFTAQADVAVLEDRRRLARELHDGVVQELGYIKSTSYALSAADGPRESILAACDRALDEARAAVHALGTPSGEPLSETLQRAVRQLTERYDVEVDFALDDSVAVSSDQRHALVRIAREAVGNAVRHGRAQRICLTLEESADRRRMSVRDDGCGFATRNGHPGAAVTSTGYGLTSMRDRARALPGELVIESEPGQGSVVEVQW